MKELFCLSFLVACGLTCSKAQSIISPPPASAGIAKMVDNPVDLHTGVPQISIPLHTIQGRKLSYPLSISYNASGFKVSEVAGSVGLGWSLNALQSIITRTVLGRPDEWPNGYFQFADSIPDETDQIPNETLFSLANGSIDMQPDIFYYSTGLEGGKFLFDNQLTPQTIPKKQLKISFDATTSLTEAWITSYDGTKYIFAGGETCALSPLPEAARYGTSWYLSKIISVDNTDTITFNYTTHPNSSYEITERGFLYLFYDVPEEAIQHSQHEIERTFGAKTIYSSGTKYLDNITYHGGKVAFEFSTDTDQVEKLDALIVYERNPISGLLVDKKRISFSYTYLEDPSKDGAGGGSTKFDEGSGRHVLASIQEFAPYNSSMPPYQFTYSSKKLPATYSMAQDRWGYYNGADSNQSLVPAMTFQGVEISTSSRSMSSYYIGGGLLHKIISPLGGITEYTFENNRYGSNNAYGPGMRVAKVTVKDPYSNIEAVTNYEYEDPSTGASSGKLLYSPSLTPVHLPVEDQVHGDTLNYYCMLIPVHATNIGALPTSLIYEYVTTYKGNSYDVAGKTTSKLSISPAASGSYPYFPEPDYSWQAGNLKEVKYYKVNGADTIVSATENTFIEHPTANVVKGLNASWNKLYVSQTPQVTDLIVKNFAQPSVFQYLNETTRTVYEQNSYTIHSSNAQSWSYDRTDGFYLPNKVTTGTSDDNRVLQKEFTYSVDYPGTDVFDSMRILNMISYPVEVKTSYVEGNDKFIVDYQKTDFAHWSATKIYPITTYTAKMDVPVEESIFLTNPSVYQKVNNLFESYNQEGFLTQSRIDGGPSNAVIIDRVHAAPVAQITNAKSNEVAYTSFESTDYGGWTVDGGSQPATKTLTLYSNGQITSVPIESSQTLNYTYTISRTQGEPVELIFSGGGPDIIVGMTLPSGSGSVTLGPGSWSASLHFDTNVSSVEVNFSYAYTKYNQPIIYGNDFKTGNHLLYLTATNTISKTNLPAGNYLLTYYQKGGTANVAFTGGASLTNTEVLPAGTDGFELVTNLIQISGPSDVVELTGSNIKMDELRLHPEYSFMNTACYDESGRVQTVSDVNVRSRFYEYDEWNRIKVVRDHGRDIHETYEYNVVGN